MNRRNFLTKLGIGAAACAVVPSMIEQKSSAIYELDELGHEVSTNVPERFNSIMKYPATYDECYSPDEIIRIYMETGNILFKPRV